MLAITRLPALGLFLGLVLATTSCSYFREEAATKLYNKGVDLQKQNSLDEALAAYHELIDKYSQDTANPAILKVVCAGMQNEIYIIHHQTVPKRSTAPVDAMIATCGADPREEMRTTVAEAMYNKAVDDEAQNRNAQAIETYRRVIETYGRDVAIETRRTVAAATVNLGIGQGKNNQPAEAVSTFRQMISTYASEADGEIREQRAMAMYNLGGALQRGRQFDEAVTIYDQLIASYATAKGNVFRNLVMKGLAQQARTYVALNRPDDAGKDYVQLIKAFAPGNTPEERVVVASSGVGLGDILRAKHRVDDAVRLYDETIGTYSGDTDNDVRATMAVALQNKAMALEERSLDDSLAVFEQVVKTYGADHDASISWTVGYSLNAAAYKRLLIAKREWRNKARALAELHAAQSEITASLARIPNRSWTLGNLAYVQWLLGDQAASAQSFASALADPQNGGATIYKDTLSDVALFPIREDAAFHKMIDQEWLKYGAEHPGNS